MKSVIMACWLLTTAFGNLFVAGMCSCDDSYWLLLVFAEINLGSEAAKFFFYAGLMAAFSVIFIFVAYTYVYYQPPPEKPASSESIHVHLEKQPLVANDSMQYDPYVIEPPTPRATGVSEKQSL